MRQKRWLHVFDIKSLGFYFHGNWLGRIRNMLECADIYCLIDLSDADKNAEIPIFRKHEDGKMDWRPDLYARLYELV